MATEEVYCSSPSRDFPLCFVRRETVRWRLADCPPRKSLEEHSGQRRLLGVLPQINREFEILERGLHTRSFRCSLFVVSGKYPDSAAAELPTSYTIKFY
jgi:hypothetical protein